MGQEQSNLQKLCCNNNLCNFDSNIENVTEVNRLKGATNGGSINGGAHQQHINEEYLVR